jgi:tetratricopeptide (TPR) repeat protein
MSSDFVRRIKSEISRAEHASPSVLAEIEDELAIRPSAELWILRGDALQLSDDDDEDVIEEVEASYRQALELDPSSADAYESLGHFLFSVHDDAGASIDCFRRALALGAGLSAREGLKEAEDELAEMGGSDA